MSIVLRPTRNVERSHRVLVQPAVARLGKPHRLFDYFLRTGQLAHVAHTPPVARTDEPESLVRDLR